MVGDENEGGLAQGELVVLERLPITLLRSAAVTVSNVRFDDDAIALTINSAGGAKWTWGLHRCRWGRASSGSALSADGAFPAIAGTVSAPFRRTTRWRRERGGRRLGDCEGKSLRPPGRVRSERDRREVRLAGQQNRSGAERKRIWIG